MVVQGGNILDWMVNSETIMATREERLATFKVADVSTGHMRAQDARILDDLAGGESAKLPLIAATSYGYLVHVRRDEDDFELVARDLLAQGFSSCFIAVIRWAREEGCAYVLFDADGERYDSRPEGGW